MPSTADRDNPRGIVVVGPPLDQIGGMTSVVRQMLAMDFDGRFDVRFVPFTLSENDRERWWNRGLRHLRQMRVLDRAIRATYAPIVHLHTCSAVTFYRTVIDLLIARRLGIKTILHIHGAKFDAFYEQEPRYRQRIVRWALSRADRVIALSTDWSTKLARIAPNAHLVTIENAVDIPSASDGRSGADGWRSGADGCRSGADGCRFLLLARMDEWKGIDDLLTACASLRERRVAFELTLAGPPGTAGDAAVLDAKIRGHQLGSTVRYIGPVEGAQKDALLRDADVYVQPSHHEGMPIALLEALAYGLPVVATRVGAIPEVLEHDRHGLLVPPRCPEELARAMSDLARDGSRRHCFAEAARMLAESRFSVERFRADLAAVYDDLCGEASPGALRPAGAGADESGVADVGAEPMIAQPVR